jgi:uncharacterized protein YaaQ
MKMIVAIIEDAKVESVSQTLIKEKFRVTQLATTGGFLRGGATTLMVGVADDLVEKALQIIRDKISTEVEKKQATLYVLNVKSFDRV